MGLTMSILPSNLKSASMSGGAHIRRYDRKLVLSIYFYVCIEANTWHTLW